MNLFIFFGMMIGLVMIGILLEKLPKKASCNELPEQVAKATFDEIPDTSLRRRLL